MKQLRTVHRFPLTLGLALGLATAASGQLDWVRIPIAPSLSPSARELSQLAASGRCGCLLLYGGRNDGHRQGLADTWRLDGLTWTLVDPNSAPGIRWGHAMSHDTRTGDVLMFGGRNGTNLSDTWLWNGSGWTSPRTGLGPSARHSTSLTYDEARSVHVLFGGVGAYSYNDETWEWDGQRWNPRRLAVRPSARRDHAMVYDRDRRVVVLFGGQRNATVQFNDTWEYDGTSWVQRFPATSPSPRSMHSLVYDEKRDRVVLYGGMVAPTTSGATPLHETWDWDGNDWRQRNTASSPTTTSENAVAYAPSMNVTVSFGGRGSQDTWFLHSVNPAFVWTMSVGCVSSSTGSAPILEPAAHPGDLPWLGDPFALEMRDIPPGGQPVLLLGLSRRSWGGLTLPTSLAPFGGGPGCVLAIRPDATPPMVPSAGGTRATLPLPVPNLPSLVRARLFAQGAVLEPAGSPSALTTTNGLDIQIGSR